MKHYSKYQNFLKMGSLIFIITARSGVLGERKSQIFIFMITERINCCRGLSKRSMIGV